MTDALVTLTQPCLALVQQSIELSLNELRKHGELTPIMLTNGPNQSIEKIELPDNNTEQALQKASDILSPGDGEITMYCIVMDGITEWQGKETDCLIIEAGQTGLDQALQLMQPYRQSSAGLQLLGNVQAVRNLPARLTLRPEVEAELKQAMQPLFQAPYTIFAYMKEAGEQPPGEYLSRFQNTLADGLSHAHPLVAACVQQSVESAQGMSQIISSEGFDAVVAIDSLQTLLKAEFPVEAANEYRRFLLQLANTLAYSENGQERLIFLEKQLFPQ